MFEGSTYVAPCASASRFPTTDIVIVDVRFEYGDDLCIDTVKHILKPVEIALDIDGHRLVSNDHNV